jgi:hypothetical protein
LVRDLLRDCRGPHAAGVPGWFETAGFNAGLSVGRRHDPTLNSVTLFWAAKLRARQHSSTLAPVEALLPVA